MTILAREGDETFELDASMETEPPSQKALQLELTLHYGEGWKVPPIPAGVFNVNTSDLERVNRQCTMQPLATFQ